MMPTKRRVKRGKLSKPKPLTTPSPSLKLMGVNQQTRQVWLVAEVATPEEAKKTNCFRRPHRILFDGFI